MIVKSYFIKANLITFIICAIILFVSDFHAQWIKQNSGVAEKLSDVVMLDSITAIVVGENGAILKTTDAGETWNRKEPAIAIATSWNAVSFYNEYEGVIVGKYNVIMTTTDAGEQWVLRATSGQENRFLSALYLGPGHIYAGDDSGKVWRSVDSGKTWSSEKLTDLPIRSIFPWRGVYILGLPIYALTPFSIFTKMEFPSSPWAETRLHYFMGLGSQAFSGEFCFGGGPGYIVGVQGDFVYTPTILRKQMNDTTWLPVTLNFGIGELYNLSAPSADVAYACGTSGMILKTSDGGDSWSSLSTPNSHSLYSIYFINETRGFAVGDSGTILFTENGGQITDMDEKPQTFPNKLSLEQNYPNPFNPTTTIKFTIPPLGTTHELSLRTTLIVYDILGSEIITLVNEQKQPGTYEVEFDGSQLTSGFYFCLLKAGQFTQTKKMLLIK